MAQSDRRSSKRDTLLVKSAEILGWALGGLEREIAQTRDRLATLVSQAATVRTRLKKLGRRQAASPAPAPPTRAARKPRRAMSAAARKKLSESMKKLWAERKAKS